MDRDFSGQIIKGRKGLSHWGGLFEEWRLLNEKICRLDPEDAPYWYNEMTNVSVLAGAAWRAGYVALSEIQTEKNSGKQSHWGRADLFIQNDYRAEYIEAKFSSANASNSQKVAEKLDETLSRAIKDTKSTAGKDYNGIAVTFISPYWTAKQLEMKGRDSDYDLDDDIEELIEHVVSVMPHALAWSFPAASRELEDDSGAVWPGVFLAIQNINVK